MAKKKAKTFGPEWRERFAETAENLIGKLVSPEGSPISILAGEFAKADLRLNPSELQQALWGAGWSLSMKVKGNPKKPLAAEWHVYPHKRENWSALK